MSRAACLIRKACRHQPNGRHPLLHELMLLTCSVQSFYDNQGEVWSVSGRICLAHQLQHGPGLWDDVTALWSRNTTRWSCDPMVWSTGVFQPIVAREGTARVILFLK